jgi:hypothetical protein
VGWVSFEKLADRELLNEVAMRESTLGRNQKTMLENTLAHRTLLSTLLCERGYSKKSIANYNDQIFYIAKLKK